MKLFKDPSLCKEPIISNFKKYIYDQNKLNESMENLGF